jgi:hypothetical protein
MKGFLLTEKGSRREFLRSASVAIAGIAIGPQPFATAAAKVNASRPFRGLMVDAGRVPESIDYYRRVIDFCAEWELNALHFRLADDQGSALRFTSVPDLVTHRNAFTAEQLHSLAEYGQQHGVELIPELESFGHTGYITRSPTYAHLLDSDPRGSSEFSGVIPVNPGTLELFEKLYREVAAIFLSKYFHAGCDEVNWGGSALSRKALKTQSRAQIWAEYLNALNKTTRKLQKEMIVWGDFVLHKEPAILGLLDKNIILMDWNYSDTNAVIINDTLSKIRANGSRAIGAPGLTCYRWGPRVGAEQLRNIDAFADSYYQEGDAASLGVILTNWIPSRYIQDSIWDGFAYAAIAFNDGTAIAQGSAFPRFVEKHYGAAWDENWAEVFRIFYDEAPFAHEPRDAEASLVLPLPWSDDEQLAELLKQGNVRPNPFARLRSVLVLVEPSVMKNYSDFKAFALCAEYLERLFWRESVMIDAAKHPLQREDADALIQTIAELDAALAIALSADWDRGRPADSEARLAPLFGFGGKDQLLFEWERAATYTASLASKPEKFHQILTAKV